MKTLHYLSAAVIACLLTCSINLAAQPQPNNQVMKEHRQFGMRGNMGVSHQSEIPNITDDQKAKIKELRLAHFKEVQPLKNQIGELKAKQKTLSTAEKPDMKLINANIDDITKVQNQLMKSGAQLNQQIRALLTDEQRIAFDMKKGGKKMKHGRPFMPAQNGE
jgi:Spy/CpxP family protein refolding chaperone